MLHLDGAALPPALRLSAFESIASGYSVHSLAPPDKEFPVDCTPILFTFVRELDPGLRNEGKLFLGVNHGATKPLDTFRIFGEIFLPLGMNVF